MSYDYPANALNHLITASHEFSLDFYKVLAQKNENVVFSPIAIFMTLVLTYTGAKNKTAKEMATHLHVPSDNDILLDGIRELMEQIRGTSLIMANELIFDTAYELKNEFLLTANAYFDFKLPHVNFRTDFQHSEKLINSWVSKKTKRKFNLLFPNGTLDEFTKLVLANAVQFTGEWALPMDKKHTSIQPFYLSRRSSMYAPMMHIRSTFHYIATDSFKVLELLFKDQDFRMIIFLPKQINGLKGMEKKLTYPVFSDILNKLRLSKEVPVRVEIPNFRLTTCMNAKEALKKLGMTTMFNETQADFSGISEPGETALFISKAMHKASVEIGELGGRTSGVSGLQAQLISYSFAIKPRTHSFIVDHPFMFQIFFRDVIIFNGRYVSP